jgi:hypothetical protein
MIVFVVVWLDILGAIRQTAIFVIASVKEDQRGGEGHTSTSLLHQSPMWYHAVNMYCFYTSTFSTLCFILSAMDGKTEQSKFCVKLSKSATETLEMPREVLENIL